MSFDTKIDGEADHLTGLADWLSGTVATAVDDSATAIADTKADIGSEWEGATADAAVARAGDLVTAGDDLSTRTTTVSGALSTYADALATATREAQWIRDDATAGGLTVSGTTVLDPEDPADTTQAALYNDLSTRMTTTRTTLSTAQDDLRTELTPGDVSTLYNVPALGAYSLGIAATAGYATWSIGRAMVINGGKMAATGAARLSSLRSLSQVADPAGFYWELDHAQSMVREGNAMRAAGGANYKLKVPKGATRLGNGLAVVGTGLGIWADMNDGESTGQAVTSNVAATAVGIGASTLATGAVSAGTSLLASTATGAALGSVVPGVGTVVGGAVGLAAGVTASFFTDGFVDSLFEDHKGVGHAVSEGAKAVGDGFKSVGNAVSDGWHAVFG